MIVYITQDNKYILKILINIINIYLLQDDNNYIYVSIYYLALYIFVVHAAANELETNRLTQRIEWFIAIISLF